MARPLPAFANGPKGNTAKRTSKKHNRACKKDDDTPRAFKRLMAVAQGKKIRSGLDGEDIGRTPAAALDRASERPRIQPGESLRSFSARVNASLPVAGLAKKTRVKDGKDELGFKVQRTRKERKMHKLYEQWRAEDRKIQESKEDELELVAARGLENDDDGMLAAALVTDGIRDAASGAKRPRKRRSSAEDDPWLELKQRRAESRLGLQDLALRPPDGDGMKTNYPAKDSGTSFKGSSVPKLAGSLRRREELEATRDQVVELYRKVRGQRLAKYAIGSG